MIAKFANRRGEINYGIVVAHDQGGMIQVHWAEFSDLLRRLEATGHISDFVRKGLSKRLSWVRVEENRANGATMELLPIETKVEWNDTELATIQANMIANGE